MSDALRANEDHILEDLRRATRPGLRVVPTTNDQEPTTSLCAIHKRPYADGRSICDQCIADADRRRGSRTPMANEYKTVEIALLRDTSLPSEVVAKRIGRKVSAVCRKRDAMGIRIPGEWRIRAGSNNQEPKTSTPRGAL